MMVGCASPGAPKPPSLQLPEVVRDLKAQRSGDSVELRFTLPTRTSDGLLLQPQDLHATLCRQDMPGRRDDPCRPIDKAETDVPLHTPPAAGSDVSVVWSDHLTASLLQGPARPVSYRVEVRNQVGKSAGFSEPVFAAAGPAPETVTGLQVLPVRSGVLLQWTAVPDQAEVLVERVQLEPAPAMPKPQEAPRPAPKAAHGRKKQHAEGTKPTFAARGTHGKTQDNAPGTVWLQASPGDPAAEKTIDGTVADGTRYRYTLVRQQTLQAGGRSLQLRSAPSAALEVTWRDIYPPLAPEGLTAAGYSLPGNDPAKPASFAVDLVWQPVNDPRVSGYVVSRAALGDTGQPGAPIRLTPQPVTTPAFHDATALPDVSYQYQVSAIDGKGNTSPPAVATVSGGR